MSIIPSLIVAIGSLLAVLITGYLSIRLFYRRRETESQRVNKAVAAEIHRLLKYVIPPHKDWWKRCQDSNDEDLPLIPFTTPVYDEHAKNIGMLDDDFVATAASFYGYVQFLNALQKSRKGYIKLNKLSMFVGTYQDALQNALDVYGNAFAAVFKRYGLS